MQVHTVADSSPAPADPSHYTSSPSPLTACSDAMRSQYSLGVSLGLEAKVVLGGGARPNA